MDTILVPLPTREWAVCAVDDLRLNGLSAELAGQDAAGLWLVRVEGPAGTIAEIRYGLNVAGAAVNWETLVNTLVRE